MTTPQTPLSPMRRITRFTTTMFAALITLSTLVATPALASNKVDVLDDDHSTAGVESAATDVNVWRLFNPYTHEHLFTVNQSEYDRLGSSGWQQEGMAWVAPSTSSTPVYRLYNRFADDHFYTTSRDEYDSLERDGWSGEEIGWYSDDAQQVPVFRLFNPYETGAGAHHFTTNLLESIRLQGQGWTDEKTGWYGIEAGNPVTPAPNPGGETGGSGETNPGGGDPQPSDPVAESFYWINTDNHKIHGDSCPSFANADFSKPHWKKVMTPAEAAVYLAQNYTKCERCNPTGI